MTTPAVADRVSETTTTTGTGTVSLLGALSRYRGFVATLGTNKLVDYVIVHRSANEFEVGSGTITSGAPDTLSRQVVRSSSNLNALVSFSAGTKDVFIAPSAGRVVSARDAYIAASF